MLSLPVYYHMVAYMSREKRLNIRISDYEYQQLQDESVRRGVSMADIVRGWIGKLPRPGEQMNTDDNK